jgi:hypothetical protein
MFVQSTERRWLVVAFAFAFAATGALSCAPSGGHGDALAGDSDGGGGGIVVQDVAPNPDAEPPPEICGSDDDCPTKAASRCVSPGRCRACADDFDCGVWQRCHLGACLARVCKPGEVRCDGDTAHTCNADGKGWSAFICLAGTCSSEGCTACLPGKPMCVGDGVHRCNAAGTAFEPFSTCAATQRCTDGACRDCLTPGEVSCSFGRAVRCGSFGSWEIIDNCPTAGKHCASGKCIDCEPANLRCSGQEVVCVEGGKTRVIQACNDSGLLCYQSACWPKCGDYDFKTQTEGSCDEGVCCEFDSSELVQTGRSECESVGGHIIPWHVCQEPVCCELPNGKVNDLGIGKCAGLGGSPIAADYCATLVCCRHEGLRFEEMPTGACHQSGGSGVAPAWCASGPCCALDGGASFIAVDATACAAANGVPVPGAVCGDRLTEQTLLADNLSVKFKGACDYVPFMVVPSTPTDSLVVFDLDTLAVATPAFKVCDDPSRVVMTAATDIFTACRAGASLARSSREGVVDWVTKLPGCNVNRGVAVTPDGRLFTSCYTPGRIWEIDPDTGAIVLGTERTLSGPVYGLVADSTGLYAAGGGVRKVRLGGADDLTEAWSITRSTYGVATDGLGTIWVGGQGLAAIDGDDGSLIESWDLGSFTTGVVVAPGGEVVAAGGLNTIFVVVPGQGVTRTLPLPAGAVGPRGVSVDALGNIYAVNIGSANVTRITPTGEMENFGGGGLDHPYSYNGDLTGFSSSCVRTNTSNWESDPIDAGKPVGWFDVAWTADLPPGTKLTVWWRVDDAGSWTVVPKSGDIIAAWGQRFSVRASLSTSEADAVPTLHSLRVRWIP